MRSAIGLPLVHCTQTIRSNARKDCQQLGRRDPARDDPHRSKKRPPEGGNPPERATTSETSHIRCCLPFRSPRRARACAPRSVCTRPSPYSLCRPCSCDPRPVRPGTAVTLALRNCEPSACSADACRNANPPEPLKRRMPSRCRLSGSVWEHRPRRSTIPQTTFSRLDVRSFPQFSVTDLSSRRSCGAAFATCPSRVPGAAAPSRPLLRPEPNASSVKSQAWEFQSENHEGFAGGKPASARPGYGRNRL